MRITLLAIVMVVLGISYAGSSALAQNTPANQQQSNSPTNNTGGNAPATGGGKPVLQFDRPVKDTFPQLFNRFIGIMMALAATVSAIFIVVGGFQLALSRGNAESVATGKKTITWAVIGLIIALMAFAIVNFADQLIFK